MTESDESFDRSNGSIHINSITIRSGRRRLKQAQLTSTCT